MNEDPPIDRLLAAMMQGARAELATIVDEESEAAAVRVRERIAQIAPRLVMQMFTAFDVSRYEKSVVITVKNDVAEASNHGR